MQTTTTPKPDDLIALPAFAGSGLTYSAAVTDLRKTFADEAARLGFDTVDPFAPGWQNRESKDGHLAPVFTAAEQDNLAEIDVTIKAATGDFSGPALAAFNRRTSLKGRARERGRALFAHLREVTLTASAWTCPCCSASVALHTPIALPWELVPASPSGWRCVRCESELTRENNRIAEIHHLVSVAEAAVAEDGNKAALNALSRAIARVDKLGTPHTPEGKAARAEIDATISRLRVRLRDLWRLAGLRRFEILTPSIYIKTDPARLPAPRAFERAVAVCLAVAKQDAPSIRAIAPHDEFIDQKRGLLVWGETGQGKTRSLFAGGRALLDSGNCEDPRIVAPDEIKTAASSGAWPDLRAELLAHDLLIVDDLSHARFSEAYAAALLNFVEHVTADDGPLLLFSVQCSGRDLVKKWIGRDLDLRPTAEAIARRLAQFLVAVEFKTTRGGRHSDAPPCFSSQGEQRPTPRGRDESLTTATLDRARPLC